MCPFRLKATDVSKLFIMAIDEQVRRGYINGFSSALTYIIKKGANYMVKCISYQETTLQFSAVSKLLKRFRWNLIWIISLNPGT